MTRDDHFDALHAVSRRRRLLAALEDGPASKAALADALDCSRSTVDRAVRELESLELLDRDADGVRLTVPGRLALAECRRSADVLETVCEAGPHLECLPADAPLDRRLFEGATVHEPEPHAPNELVEEIAELLDGAALFRCLSGAERTPLFRERIYERTVGGDLDAEAVFTDDLVAYLLASIPETLREVIVRGGFDVYARPSVPYSLALLEGPDGRYTFVVAADDREVRAVVRNESPAAFEWGMAVYRRYRAGATRLPPPE